jgi:hypothetical protein
MHSLLHVVMALILLACCGYVTAKFFGWEKQTRVTIGFTLLRNRYFWLGAAVGVLFLWGDFKFAHELGSIPA